MFFGINMLNDWAFAFSISVPVHIILRSFGSVTTMMMGWLRGKRYSLLQVLSVALLTVGVLVSAWADSEGKGKSMAVETESSTSDFSVGLAILLLAQLLSAWMGAYVEDTYAEYQADWTENLFWTHFMSLPLFLPLGGPLRRQYAKLAATPHLDLKGQLASKDSLISSVPFISAANQDIVLSTLESLPSGLLYLLLNTLTQLACISGVNLLSAKSSAVTVTIVLNIRKLVSFIFSTIFFGHALSGKMAVGSAMVFGSGALYGWETSWRLPRERRGRRLEGEKHGMNAKVGMNGEAKKER
ncbi:golgi uridine diphosphate-N-acetylglucosamine transporter [Recurvomyces mirabilis]|uniref:Golgi uridine diphosphate-N-acetylglucosamine transporter n=1 Tax=Recurvomyces mirabilis TaxID=574656 RepID=A0AAE0TLP5_9PEZI|nr:golgi uridine diphosphate-N-acetylglucosamine transporter [Recurvomyces mirabilis]